MTKVERYRDDLVDQKVSRGGSAGKLPRGSGTRKPTKGFVARRVPKPRNSSGALGDGPGWPQSYATALGPQERGRAGLRATRRLWGLGRGAGQAPEPRDGSGAFGEGPGRPQSHATALEP